MLLDATFTLKAGGNHGGFKMGPVILRIAHVHFGVGKPGLDHLGDLCGINHKSSDSTQVQRPLPRGDHPPLSNLAVVLNAARLLRLTLPLWGLGFPFLFVQSEWPAWVPLFETFVRIAFSLGSLLLISVAWSEKKDFFSGWLALIEVFMGCLAGLPGLLLTNGMVTMLRTEGKDNFLFVLVPVCCLLLGWSGGITSDRFLLGLALAWLSFWSLQVIAQARPEAWLMGEEPKEQSSTT